jgi:hypothetical protein
VDIDANTKASTAMKPTRSNSEARHELLLTGAILLSQSSISRAPTPNGEGDRALAAIKDTLVSVYCV